MTQPAVDCVLDVRAPLGECPVWCERRQALYWIDVYDGKLNRFDPASGGNRVWRFSEPLGSIALSEDDAVLVGLKSGLSRYDLASEALTPLASPERDRPDNRMNDGRCDAAGRFWVGTMRDPPDAARPDGTLYRLDPDPKRGKGRCTPMVGGLVVSNGLAFSPDGRTLYHSDSHVSVRKVWAWDLDLAEGSIANRRLVIDTHGLAGPPAGACGERAGSSFW